MNARILLAAGKAAALLLSCQLLPYLSDAQVRYTSNAVDLVINGTSTLHDWSMKSAKADCAATFDLNAAGAVSGIEALTRPEIGAA